MLGDARSNPAELRHSGLARAVRLTRRALEASTLAEVWGEIAGFLAVELDAGAVLGLERQEDTGLVRVRARCGDVPTPVGSRVPAERMPPLVASVLPSDRLPWPVPGPVHLVPITRPGGARPGGALVVGRPAGDPTMLLSFAASLLGTHTERLRASARAMRDSAYLTHATAALTRARDLEAARRAAIELLAARAPRCVLRLRDPQGDRWRVLATPDVTDPERLLARAAAAQGGAPQPVLAHDQGSDVLLALPMRVGRADIGRAVITLDGPLERASEKVPLFAMLVDRITLALHNAWLLEQARREANSQTHLLAVVSHDLRNPLASLLLHAEALRQKLRRGDHDGGHEILENIQAAARQMDRLIGDLRDVEAARRGRLGIEPRPCDVAALLGGTVEAWRPRADAKEIALSCALPPEPLPRVRLDPVRVRQVVDNLLSNALAVTAPGGRVEVAADRADRHLHIRVIDSGPGVPEEARERIFESFQRAEGATYHGLGLGLSIARSIVDLHGGRLELERSSPEGACFCVRLPIAPGP